MKPYKHQLTTTQFFIDNARCHCWNDAGTGKTASTIWAFLWLMKNANLKRILVICTKSTMENVWWRECFKLCPALHVVVLDGSKDKRVRTLENATQVAVINHDGVKTIYNELMRWKPELVIIDESTAVKTVRTNRWKKTNQICKKAGYVWLLTGTPAPQSPLDLYGQGKIVDAAGTGKSFVRFRDALMIQTSMYTWEPRDDWEQRALDMIGSVIRFTRSECLDLPTVTYTNYFVGLSKSQLDTFKNIRNDAVAFLQNTEEMDVKITAVHEGVIRLKLLQICCGYVYGNLDIGMIGEESQDKRITVDLNPKFRIDALIDIINECKKGVLAFAPFRKTISELSKLLTSKNIKNRQITGATTGKNRTEIIDEFQSGALKVIIAHPRTLGHGVTLTTADTIVWYCVTSDNEIYEQANARINRIGQTCKMRVIHLLSTKFEEAVLAKLQKKQKTQRSLLNILQQEV